MSDSGRDTSDSESDASDWYNSDSEDTEMDTDEFSDPDDTPSKRLTSKKESIKGRIKSARNWFIINLLFFIGIIATLSIFYGLGWLSFNNEFNSTIN